MAQQAADSSGGSSGITSGHAIASAWAGLNLYWSEPHESLLVEWEKWLELFTVALMAKASVSLSRLTRTEGGEWVAFLTGGFSEEAASRKVISIPFLSIGQAARKILLNKFPMIQIAIITLPVFCINVSKVWLWNRIELWTDFVSSLKNRWRERAFTNSGMPWLTSLRGASSKDKEIVWSTTSLFWTCTKKRCKKDCVQKTKIVQRKHSNLPLHSKKQLNDKLHTGNAN